MSNDKLNKLRDRASEAFEAKFGNWDTGPVEEECYKAGWDAALKAAAELAPEFNQQALREWRFAYGARTLNFFTEERFEDVIDGARWQYEQDKVTIGALKAELERTVRQWQQSSIDWGKERATLRAQADALAEALDQIAQYHSHAPELNRIFEIARVALAKYRGEK
jgi:hypothetical protein